MLDQSDEYLMLLAGIASTKNWERQKELALEAAMPAAEDDCPHGLFEKRESGLGEVLGLRCAKCNRTWEKVGSTDGRLIFVPSGDDSNAGNKKD